MPRMGHNTAHRRQQYLKYIGVYGMIRQPYLSAKIIQLQNKPGIFNLKSNLV